MKRIVAILATLLMIASMTLSVVAAGAFVSSPSRNEAPELISGENESHECTAELVITPYSERHTLPDELREQMEAAYAELLACLDLTSLNEALDALAEELGIDAADLAVADLFDIHYVNCEDHLDHGHFDIVLKPESLKGFVGLLHCHDGVWHLIEGAEITNNGTHLEFDIKEFSPFAIVVSTANPPQTSDNTNFVFYLIVMIVSAVTAVIFWRLSKKQTA